MHEGTTTNNTTTNTTPTVAAAAAAESSTSSSSVTYMYHPHHDTIVNNTGLSSVSGLQDYNSNSYSPPDDDAVEGNDEIDSLLHEDDYSDEDQEEDDGEIQRQGGTATTHHRQATAALVRNIASFITLSDAASLGSRQQTNTSTIAVITTPLPPADTSWREDDAERIGGGFEAEDSSWSLATTPPTPGLVAISPGATPGPNTAYHQHHRHNQDYEDDDDDDDDDDEHVFVVGEEEEDKYNEDDSVCMQQLLRERRRRWAQEKLASAVLAHPLPIRAYCLDAYHAAQEICRQEREQALQAQHQQKQLTRKVDGEADPETWVEPCQSSASVSNNKLPATTASYSSLIPRTMTKFQHHHHRKDRRLELIHELIDCIFHNVPVSVFLDLVDAFGNLTLDTSYATVRICIHSVNGTVSAILYLAGASWDAVVNFNPFHVLEMMISLQFNAMGKTSEVLVSGIQSVATGVESASSMALHRLSAANLSLSNNRSTSGCGPATVAAGTSSVVVGGGSGHGGGSLHHPNHHDYSLKKRNRKLLKKMSSINDAARVVAYREHPDDTGGGLTRQAISRTRRMMHYSVSLRPFVATVAVKTLQPISAQQQQVPSQTSPPQRPVISQVLDVNTKDPSSIGYRAGGPNTSSKVAGGKFGTGANTNAEDCSTSSSPPRDKNDGPVCVSPNGSISNTTSPLICSPQSFPPTPRSRQMVLARGSQFADDVVFLARDRLRVHGGLESRNERTREMAWALKEGKRLAIFENPHNNNNTSTNLGLGGGGGGGIELTCGQHIATKVGNMHYASTRSMVPVLRNCYVYFEITVMPSLLLSAASLDPNAQPQAQHVVVVPPMTLSIGLSTLEMPSNTLVGSWPGSVGLCSTGQILMAGQWLLPSTNSSDPSQCVVGAYGYGATVGCLVFLDDASSFETWDGVMVHASVQFSINGVVVPPPTLLTHSHPPSGVGVGVGSVGVNSHASAATTAPIVHHHHHHAATAAAFHSSPQHHRPPPLQMGLPTMLGADSATPVTSSSSVTLMTPTLLVPASEELYPTVTLQTPATAVMCRFSSEDVIYANASNVFGLGGAPRTATVYAVDGSVIYSPDNKNTE